MKLRWLERNSLVLPYMLLCLTEKEFLAANKHLKVKETPIWTKSNHCATTHTYERDDKITCIVCMCKENSKKYSLHSVIGLLAHEATHIWQAFCESIGEHAPSKEFEAYCIQFITQRLVEEYLHQTKRVSDGPQKTTRRRQDRRRLGKKGNKKKTK